MNDLTLASAGALVLRMLTVAFFVLLYLLPLILRTWRGETTHDRHTAARTERERAELEAETAIAIKRAEVRRTAEIMWAEHQLTQTRLAIEAQAEIDREQQRRRVVEAFDAPVLASSERTFKPVEEDMYLPIAAEAEAASRASAARRAELPAGQGDAGARTEVPENLPAPIEPVAEGVEYYEPPAEIEATEERTPLIPSIPDATKAAARWIRPLVPPFVARVIDNTTQPLRTARQVYEEVEEIAFSLKRTRKITVDAESSEGGSQQRVQSATPDARADTAGANRIESSRGQAAQPTQGDYREDYEQLGAHAARPSLGEMPPRDFAGLSVGSGYDDRRELAERDGPRELRSPEGPRQLPPGK
jgi:hypothetical protein